MLCKYGEQYIPANGNGKFFVCRLAECPFNGKQCPFSKICVLVNEYIPSTDAQGRTCVYYSV